MITVIKKGTPIKKMKELMDKAFSKSAKNDIRKYAGILKTEIDPLEYQKQCSKYPLPHFHCTPRPCHQDTIGKDVGQHLVEWSYRVFHGSSDTCCW